MSTKNKNSNSLLGCLGSKKIDMVIKWQPHRSCSKNEKAKKIYNIQEGMIFNKDYYGKSHRLLVVNNDGVLQFKVDNQIFPTLTAAARHVCGDATRQISGPIFWGIQSTDSKS